MELHAGEGVLPGAAVVFEGDPFKLHAAVGHLLHRILRRIQHNILVQHLADAAALARERVSSRNTLEMSIMEFITWST